MHWQRGNLRVARLVGAVVGGDFEIQCDKVNSSFNCRRILSCSMAVCLILDYGI